MLQIPTYATIARNKAESAHPELWPVHAWCPAIQRGGNVVQDFCGQAHATMNGVWDWNPDMPGIRTSNNGTSYNYGRLASGVLSDMGQDYTIDLVMYHNPVSLPIENSSYVFLFGSSINQNYAVMRYLYTSYYNDWRIQYGRNGWSSASDYGDYHLTNGTTSANGARYRNLWFIRLVCARNAHLVFHVNGFRGIGINTVVTATTSWSIVKDIFGYSAQYTYATHGTALYMALHNRIIDEPLTDPFGWLRKHKRKYYRVATTTSSTFIHPIWLASGVAI